jgi:PglZ domain
MGKVTDYLINVIAKQVDTSELVVWYDPDAHYRAIAKDLVLPGTTIVHYTGSFFALRHEVEPLMGNLEPPRMVVYVPLSQVETHNALIEIEVAGVVMKPGQQPPGRNTRLSLIARNALKSRMTEEAIASIEKQVEAGKLSLADLDKLAEGEGKGVLSIIFSIDNPQEIALKFLTGDQHDKELVHKGAESELATLLHDTVEVDLPEGETPDTYRTRLARHILSTDLVAGIQGEVPTRLATVKIATNPATREACTTVARTWRLRRDLAKSYETQANRVEKELGISALDFKQEQIANVETFLEVERKLQEEVENALLAKPTDALVELATARLSSFWSEHLPEVQAQWALIVVAGQVLLEADRIEKELKVSGTNAKAVFQAYTAGNHPWCLLDTCYRRMEHRYYDFGFQLHEKLEQLIVKARNRYMEVGSTLAETFLRAYQAQKFRIDGVLHQIEIFEKKVKPRLAEGKVAYVWVDALRYEMGYELAQSLAADSDMGIEAALGTIPTITEIGMAALLPITQTPVTVVSVGDGKLALEIGGTCIKDRKDRVNFLITHAGAGITVFEAKLEDLLPKPGKRVREGINNANLVLITSQEIDAMGEEDNISLARQTMDEILRQLRKAFRILGQLGVRTIIFTADHGHLFADELGGDMKIDAPGGDTKDLHRRIWVGHGGTADPSYLRTRLADFGIGGDLEIAVPWNFACFKVKGGTEAYFHGGMSPQELFIPVVTLTPRKNAAGTTSEIAWNLVLGSQKISTRLCSVQIVGKATSLFELIPPKVRVEIRSGLQSISLPVSASYGFEEATGDVQLKRSEHDTQNIEPNTIALVITETSQKATVSIHLLDATSGVQLARVDKIEMTIAI